MAACVADVALRIGFDASAMLLNSAGEARYAESLMAALERRADLDLVVLAPGHRRATGGIRRVALQAAVQGIWYPAVVPWRVRRSGVQVLHHPRHLVPPEIGLRVPAVTTVHDVIALRAPQYFSRVILANYRLLTPGAVRRSQRVLTGSHYSKGEIVELLDVPPERVVVTPYGVDPRFRPQPPDPELLAARYGIDRPYVLCVGTLEPRKNLLGAVSAFARVAAGRDDHLLVITGGRGWGPDGLEQEIERIRVPVLRLGRVPDEDLVALLGGASCFLYPSFAEGFGFPPLEAMACGAPVVASDGGSLPEVVGDGGILVDPHDTEAIAAAVTSLLDSPERRAELGARALARASLYTWARCASETADVYRNVVEEFAF
jgi:alpha-1,3-rhamnosyl/mannosyltransferase